MVPLPGSSLASALRSKRRCTTTIMAWIYLDLKKKTRKLNVLNIETLVQILQSLCYYAFEARPYEIRLSQTAVTAYTGCKRRANTYVSAART